MMLGSFRASAPRRMNRLLVDRSCDAVEVLGSRATVVLPPDEPRVKHSRDILKLRAGGKCHIHYKCRAP